MYKGIEFLSAIAERLLNTEMPRLGKRGVNPGGILSTQEVATILGLSHPTLLRLLKEKKIPEPQLVGSARLWNSSDVTHAQLVVQQLQGSGELRVRPLGATRTRK